MVLKFNIFNFSLDVPEKCVYFIAWKLSEHPVYAIFLSLCNKFVLSLYIWIYLSIYISLLFWVEFEWHILDYIGNCPKKYFLIIISTLVPTKYSTGCRYGLKSIWSFNVWQLVILFPFSLPSLKKREEKMSKNMIAQPVLNKFFLWSIWF